MSDVDMIEHINGLLDKVNLGKCNSSNHVI